MRYQRWEFDKDNNEDDDDSDYDEEEKDNGGDTDAVEGPLGISTLHIPKSNEDIPKCSYCQSERKFEFQVMPQMLNYLSFTYTPTNTCQNGITSTNDNPASSSSSTDNPPTDFKTKKSPLSIPKSAKQAILAISDIRERDGDENVHQEYIQTHDEALAKVKDELLGNITIPSNDNGGGKSKNLPDTHALDFGVTAVFTCVKSCGGFINGDGDGMNSGGGELGAYREEFAWIQPPLD